MKNYNPSNGHFERSLPGFLLIKRYNQPIGRSGGPFMSEKRGFAEFKMKQLEGNSNVIRVSEKNYLYIRI